MLAELEPNVRIELQQILMRRFNLEELKSLAFNLCSTYELFPHETIQPFCRELLSYFIRRGRLGCLIAEMMKQRPYTIDIFLVDLLAKLPPCQPYRKTLIFTPQTNVNRLSAEERQDLARILSVPETELELIAMVEGSLRLLVGLPEGSLRLVDSSENVSVIPFDSLDLESQNAWRLAATTKPPVLDGEFLRPVVSWDEALAAAKESPPPSETLLVGYIVGESNPQTFSFVTTPALMPGRLEYLAILGVTEKIDGQTQQIDVLAQVTELGVGSTILGSDLTYEETVAILQGQYSDRPRVIGEARVIGYLEGKESGRKSVRRPRFAAAPGHPVHVASDAFLREFFTADIERGIEIGHLINRSGVKVQLDPNGLRRHLAIIAQTGAGKSYLAGKLLESLVGLGATVFVLDPNSDYVQIRKVAEDANIPYQSARKTSFANQVDLYRVPGVEHYRFSDELVGPSKPFTVRFSDLDLDEIYELAGIHERSVRQREAVRKAIEKLQEANIDYTPKEVANRLSEIANDVDTDRDERDAARGASRYIESLSQYQIWGQVDFDLDAMLQAQRVTIADLAGGGQRVVAYVADKALREIWRRALAGQLSHPVFVLLEEAHTLVPGGRNTRASRIINTIASEGRKFRVFLMLVTQRPSKIDQEALSQCGSQIIMQVTNPQDQNSIANAAEALSKELMADLPGLNQGEAIVIGQLMRVPAMIAVSGRVSAEGGADIDLVRELERAQQSAGASQARKKSSSDTAAPRGKESML